MDLLFQLALVAHLLSLLVAGGGVMAGPLIGRQLATAAPDARVSFGGVAQQLGRYSRLAFVTLLVSGALMLWLRYGGIAGASPWFWVKMGFIVLMGGGMALGGRFRAQGNVQMAQAATLISRLSLLGVIVSAVLAFD